MFVPEHYRFPIPWWSPTGRSWADHKGAAVHVPPQPGRMTCRYSALDEAEEQMGRKLPPEAAKRLQERENRANAHMRQCFWVDVRLTMLLGLDVDAEPEQSGG
jgi:hypothetical protein